MQALDLDSVYTQLAQAIDQAGSKSELFLAMLSLKLMTELGELGAFDKAERGIASALRDLHTHDAVDSRAAKSKAPAA